MYFDKIVYHVFYSTLWYNNKYKKQEREPLNLEAKEKTNDKKSEKTFREAFKEGFAKGRKKAKEESYRARKITGPATKGGRT